MTYRVRFTEHVLGKLGKFPPDAMDALSATVALVLADPYEVLHSAPTGGDPHERLAVLGDAGFLEFTVNGETQVVIVTELVWTG